MIGEVKKFEGRASVKSVLDALTADPAYLSLFTTIEYLLLPFFALANDPSLGTRDQWHGPVASGQS